MDKIKGIQAVITAALSIIMAWLGALAVPVFILLGLNVADYITAIMAAPNRGEKINSDRGLRGIAKKVGMYIVVCLGGVVDILLSYGADSVGVIIPAQWLFALGVTIWLICNEMISILENLVDVGVEFPPFLLPIVKKVKTTVEQSKGDAGNDVALKE